MNDIVKDFFKWIPPKFKVSEVSLKLYQNTVGSSLNQEFPVDSGYCGRFCRHMLEMVEKSEDGIEHRDELIEALYSRIGESYSSGDNETAFKTYFLSSVMPELTVSLREKRAMISDGTTGLTSWTAGEYLAQWLDTHPDVIEGKSVLELGAGSGITGIFAVKRFNIGCYCLTDCHPKVLENMKYNVRNNFKEGRVYEDQDDRFLYRSNTNDSSAIEVMEADWTKLSSNSNAVEALLYQNRDGSARTAPVTTFDLILGADIVFDPDLIPGLVSTLYLMLTSRLPGVIRAVIVCCIRNPQTFAAFDHELSSHKLKVTKQTLSEESPTVVLLDIES